jgi:NAD(P)-dependent dehydrogenase (short-subunit alcohol dehydrogenase family)
VTNTSQTALVTGSANGIGNAVVQLLLADHISVIAVDVDGDAMAELSEHPDVRAIAVDLADAVQVKALPAKVGEIDYLVNCAGLIRLAPIGRFDLKSWREIFAVNTEAVFFLSQGLMPNIRDGGAIVNVASAAAKLGAATESAAYAASKAAVLSLTRSFAHELAPRGIRVNAVCPGLVDTAMQEQVIAGKLRAFGGTRDALARERLAAIPLRRVASPREVAEAVCFLLSDRASYMTGEEINVSGGMVTW